mgnify:CR=1 FL=1
MIDSIISFLIGAAIPLIKDWLYSLGAEKIERIKLHDLQRIKAYQIAYRLSTTLRISLRDHTQSKDLSFINGCAAELYSAIEHLPYYSKCIRSTLIDPETIMEHVMSDVIKIEENTEIITKKVLPLSKKLHHEIISDFETWDF